VGVRHERAMALRLQGLSDRLLSEAKLFAALNYTAVLARGFALVRDANDRPVKLAAAVKSGQGLKIQFADDTLAVIAAKKTTQGELF